MKYAVMERQRGRHPVRVMCAALEVSPSGYYAWRSRPESQRSRADRELKKVIRLVFEESRGTYGSPRIQLELREQGLRLGRERIARLMREERLRPAKTRRFRRTTISADDHPKAANVLDRCFTVEAPDRVWAGDITYLRTTEGWLYLAVLLDLYSRRVVGWAVSSRLTQDLAEAALRRALYERAPDPGLMHHSDRGCQYTSTNYQHELERHQVTVSMSRKGDCWDNAVVESFFATLKAELGDTFSTRKAARAALFDYIEIFYNRQRRHTSIGGVCPVDAEVRFAIREAA